MARTFDGTDDRVRVSAGGLSAFTFGTILLVMRRNSTAWNGLVVGHNSGGTSLWGLELGPNAGVDDRLFYLSNANSRKSTFTITNADGWILAGAGKATGTAAPRFHKLVYSSNTWTHEDANDGTVGDNTGTTSVVSIGDWELSDFLAGDVALVGVWKRLLTDTEVEQLAYSLQDWYAAAPDALLVLDQSATTQNVIDATGGGANQSSITGTSIATTSLPVFCYGHTPVVSRSIASGAVNGAAALSGGGTLAAAGSVEVLAAAALSGTGTLTASAGAINGEAGLSGIGNLTAAGSVTALAAAGLSGSGTLSAAGVVPQATVTYTVQVDWNNDGDFSDTGEDVTARTLERTALTTRYGRDQARALSPLAPGRAMFELDNVSKDYSPENTSSPLTGLVLPGRPVKIVASLSGTEYGLFRGYLDDFGVLPEIHARSVPVTCLDPLARLKTVKLSTALYHSVQTGEAIDILLDAAGWDEDLRDLDAGATTIPWWWEEDADAYEALQRILDSEGPGSLVTVDIDGRIAFRDRHHRLTSAASTTVQATFRDTGAEPLFSAPMTYDHGWRDIVNAVSFSIPARSPAGELSVVWSLTGQYTIADGQTVSITASASSAFTGAVTPVAGTDYQVITGSAAVTISRDSGQAVTVNVSASGGPATVAALQLRAYALQTTASVVVSAEDSASIEKYGRRSLPSGREPVWAGVNDAAAIADLTLAQRAERLPTVTITVKSGNTTRLTQQLVRDLSDRVGIVETQTAVDDEFYIEQIEHSITEAGLFHTTTFGCEKVATQVANPFRFDVAGAGFNDGAFGNNVSNPSTVFLLDHATQGRLNTGILGF